jgi:hypothetical protein
LDFESAVFHNFQNIPTSQGALTLVAANDTFTATVVPEPLSMLLAGMGLAGLLFRKTSPQPLMVDLFGTASLRARLRKGRQRAI